MANNKAILIVCLLLLLSPGAAHGQSPGSRNLFDATHSKSVRDALDRPPVLNALNSRAIPPTVVKFDEGGRIRDYDARWRAIAATGAPVEVRGTCQSACTIIVVHIPRARLCFGETSSLGFHQARYDDGSLAPTSTKWMMDRYPADIRAWINARGGQEKMPAPGHGYWTLPAQTLWTMGYRKCEGK